jgi:hypothetical protein
MEPGRKTGSCGMVVIRERTTARGMLEMSTPSIVMLPERMERRRKMARIRELLPLFCIRNELIPDF